MFEYIFEPPLAEQNSIFYGVGFHLFIANLLYSFFRARDTGAEEIFSEFSKFAREGDAGALQRLFPAKELIADSSNPLHEIGLFALANKAAIVDELAHLHQNPTKPNWVLDLTTTSLFHLLADRGGVYDELEVYCDKSKPLETEMPFLSVMVGRKDRVAMDAFGKNMPMSFNLVRLPELVESKYHFGIQLADVMASASARGLQSKHRGLLDDMERRWLQAMDPCFFHEVSVWPDLSHADPRTLSGFVNALVLKELRARAVRQQSYFEGMHEFIAHATRSYPQYARSIGRIKPPNARRSMRQLFVSAS